MKVTAAKSSLAARSVTAIVRTRQPERMETDQRLFVNQASHEQCQHQLLERGDRAHQLTECDLLTQPLDRERGPDCRQEHTDAENHRPRRERPAQTPHILPDKVQQLSHRTVPCVCARVLRTRATKISRSVIGWTSTRAPGKSASTCSTRSALAVARLDESHETAGSGPTDPGGRKRAWIGGAFQPTVRVSDGDFDSPKPIEQLGQRLRQHQAARVHEPDGINQPLDLVEVVRRDQNRPLLLAGPFEDPVHEVVAHDRIEPAERLVEHEQRRPVGERRHERGLDAHPARQAADLDVTRQIEVADQLAAEAVVPGRIEGPAEGRAVRRRVIHAGKLLILRDVADRFELARPEPPRIDAKDLRVAARRAGGCSSARGWWWSCPRRSVRAARRSFPAGRRTSDPAHGFVPAVAAGEIGGLYRGVHGRSSFPCPPDRRRAGPPDRCLGCFASTTSRST